MDEQDPRDRRIAELEARLDSAIAENARLTARVEELEAENRELKARLGQNSSNSSRPPSSDPPGNRPEKRRVPSGRKSGGQPGHEGHHRELAPPERVTRIVDWKPTRCWDCHRPLVGSDPSPQRYQVWELPEIIPEVTENRVHWLQCECGRWSCGELPPEVAASNFGPRLTALVSVLAGAYRLSHKNIKALCSDVFSVDMAAGSISTLQQRISDAVAVPVQEAREAIVQAKAVHADETGWREAKKKAWLWVLATTSLAVFVIRRFRNAEVARELLGAFGGILISDRFAGYAWVEASRRQLCWSHLDRDFASFADHGSDAQALSLALGKQSRRMFHFWHRVRDGTMSRAEFQKRMRPIRTRILWLLGWGTGVSSKKVVRQCRRILKLQAALFTFVDVEGVEPTNNHGEQTLRHAVIWRKTSFGTDSEAGSRFVERMLTVVMSLRLQKRNVLEWVTAAYEAKLKGLPAPSLLPAVVAQPIALAA